MRKVEDTTEKIRSRKSRKNRQYNGQEIKNLQNTTQKTKD